MPLPTHNGGNEQALLAELNLHGICQPVTALEGVNNYNNSNEDEENDGQPKQKKQKVECSVENCKNTAQSKGLCIKHGGTYLKRYYCKVEGCTSYPKRGGLCKAHGGTVKRALCKVEGCTNLETNKGVCIRHGAKTKRCKVENCEKSALKGGVCWSHGAKDTKVKKRCSVEGCEKYISKGGLCSTHGAKPCIVEGCKNKAKKDGVCVKHGAPANHKICSIGGCPTQAKVNGYCKRHNKLITNARKDDVSVIDVPPGRLGLTLLIDKILGGAKISAIDANCPLVGKVDVGDRVLSIDDNVLTKTEDFGINSDKPRKFKVAHNNSLQKVLQSEKNYLGEQLKSTLSGAQVADMQSQLQKLLKEQEESRKREADMKVQLDLAKITEDKLQNQFNEAKARVKELKIENTELKVLLGREQRRAKKCPDCSEKIDQENA